MGEADADARVAAPEVTVLDLAADRVGPWVAGATRSYAADLATTGLSAPAAERRAAEDYDRLLPGGQLLPGHRMMAVLADGVPTGVLWIGPYGSDDPTAWWVWDIRIDPDRQGRGIGRAAMRLAERVAAAGGARTLGLNVFGGNAAARHLYDSLGYRTTSLQLVLDVGGR